MRSFTFNGIESLVSPDWHVSDQINQRSTMQCTIVDMLNLTAIETGQEVIVYTEEKLGNARDIGDGTFARTSDATMQDGTIVTANVTRYETGQFGQAVMIEEGCTNIIAAYPTGWTASGTGMLTVDQGVQIGAAGSTVRLTNSAATEGAYVSPKFVLSPSTTYTLRLKVRGTVGASKFDIYILSTTGTYVQSVSGGVPVTASFVVKSVTFTTTADITGTNQLIRFDHNGNDAGYIEIAEISLIQKAYALTFPGYGATRAAEILTIPTAGILTKGNWTVELIVNVPNLTGISDLIIWDCAIAASNRYVLYITSTGYLRVLVISGGVSYQITGATLLNINTAYNIGFSCNGSVIRLYKNGVRVGLDTSYVEPVGILPANMYAGSRYTGGYQINGLIDDLRISNIARSDDEILADYNSGVTLPIDEHTTAKMAFDGTLEIFARPIIFGGTIDTLDDYEGDPGYLYYNIIAVDYNQLADKKLMAASYSSTLAGDIVSAIITAALSDEGITAGTIESGDTISKAVFNYIKATDALDYLKNVTGLNWNIDFNKQLNFFSNASNVSPWTLTDLVPHENFKRTRTRDQYRNKQYLRAGTGKTSVQTLEKPAPAPDGVSRNFILRFPIAEKPVIYVNSTAVLSANVGVNGLDTGKEWYFTYNSNTVSEDGSEAVLTAGSTLEVTYSGLYPIIAVIDDPAQISARQAIEAGTSGIYESVVTEKSINENNQAIEYSEGLILKYGTIPSIVTFDTEVPGLQAGQLLPIQKPLYGINASFLIDSVQISAADGGATNYSVRCLDGSSLGGWEEWFKELLKGNREFVINENEVVILLNVQTEAENWAGETTVITTTPLYPAENLYPSETLYPGVTTGTEVLND
jgi:hypothetical protein